MDKPYHHGNLKNALLEAGIDLINNEGESNFSLRKVAALCGVSHAAPYSHFQNKDDLLREMQAYVMAQFMQALEDTVRASSYPDDPELLIEIGKSYVLFFLHHPQYFSFLFSQPCMAIDLSMDSDDESDFPPFRLFRDMAQCVLKKMGLPKNKIKDAIISMWALVHGLASIVTMKYVRYDQNWEEKIEDFIRNNQG
ncbi:MAG: TetR/AcrR family transcriptional regulator [Clostridiaceae bacterium]|nr:TetR/AcrR family transcriptional regulator [Clostridiaceae bacterium]